MIRFKCDNCGRGMRAGDSQAGRETMCPDCRKRMTVPEPLRLKDENTSNGDDGAKVYEYLSAASPSCRKLTESELSDSEPEEKRDLVLDFAGLHFDEASLFAMSMGLFVMYVISADMGGGVQMLLSRMLGRGTLATVLSIVFVLVPFVAGIGCSIYHALSKREKSFVEEGVMLFFGVLISAGTGIAVGWHILVTMREFWLGPLAVWNFVYGVVLLSRFEGVVLTDELDGGYVSHMDATMRQIIFETIATTGLLMLCHYYLGLHWAISYSVCIAYTSSFDKAIQRVLGLR